MTKNILIKSNDELLKLSNGEIVKPDTYNYRTYLPEPNGLYNVEVFGKVNNKNFKMEQDNRNIFWGHIALVIKVPHPLNKKVEIETILIPPPASRKFKYIDIEIAKKDARERRDYLLKLNDNDPAFGCNTREEILAEEGILNEEDIDEMTEGIHQEPSLNTCFREVIIVNNRYARLVEINAPSQILNNEITELNNSVKHLFQVIENNLVDPLKQMALLIE
jgi:DNA-directed RNA polymerase beta' subunit